MSHDTVLIFWGGTYIACDTADPNNHRWHADSPKELIAKLDADGIDRSRIRLDKWEDGPHDHALTPQATKEFTAILGKM